MALVPRKSRPVAVFDIDGTVFRSSLLLELIEALIAEGIFPKEAKRQYADAWKRWQARAGSAKTGFSYYEFIAGVVFAYRKYITGVRRAELWRVADAVVNFHKVRLYRFTRDLVKRLSRTHFLLAVSHSPYEAVAPFAKSLGFDKVYAQVYEVDKSVRFTGRVLYEDVIAHKGKVLRRAMRKNNLTLKGSVGVGDTESDIPFLKLVERPIAFNPSMKLYRAAQKHGWEVVVERKDVIYQLQAG
ncbi:MAG: HAD-IB family phosphatase [Candidatus Sungbacteria bacterium]|uniref:phosphoserine phosphatase n=1 Tax=Candidatus Sungiibacteriota bacterium TaxID=2750080 RepID=A0A932YZN3_9BACT|nr:HAD-IB family phosphatase [Candidatus Sungbacteria bacterium]